jgi:hypothetical protein
VPTGFFPLGSPMASDEGLAALTGPRDLRKVRENVRSAGYQGAIGAGRRSYPSFRRRHRRPAAEGWHERRRTSHGPRYLGPTVVQQEAALATFCPNAEPMRPHAHPAVPNCSLPHCGEAGAQPLTLHRAFRPVTFLLAPPLRPSPILFANAGRVFAYAGATIG